MWVTVRAASHPPVWIHRKCELRSLRKMLNGLCWDDDYTIAQWLEHRWLQAKVPGSSPGGDSQFFLQTFPVCLFPSNQLIILLLLFISTSQDSTETPANVTRVGDCQPRQTLHICIYMYRSVRRLSIHVICMYAVLSAD